ncbi:DNA-binding protein [Arcobacter cloacae]|uniref:DNA-binding protein n=1 Tax=Arcobacter cloacae TaxID=1054034 RepID=A0A4Q0ZFU8_9BACT|nr:DNA-binding protein [Arcobacter cloacae]
MKQSNIIVYNDGELELKVSVENESVWLTQKQIAELFEVSIPNINMHIKAIYKEEELFKNRTIQKYLIVQQEGKRKVKREVEHYNLDLVISVGYRINSKKATIFRQWATSILKNYIQNGYVINGEKITNERFLSLENEVSNLKSKVENISNSLENNSLKSKQLKLDFQKYQTQYNNIEIIEFKNSHDRFLIIDKKEIYHLGASIKDLGKKWFAFSKFDIQSLEILERLK